MDRGKRTEKRTGLEDWTQLSAVLYKGERGSEQAPGVAGKPKQPRLEGHSWSLSKEGGKAWPGLQYGNG